MMNKTLISLGLACSILAVNQAYAQSNTQNTKTITPALQLTEHNKQIVLDFYQGVFQKQQVQAYADRYIAQQYRQHNPYVADGKAPFVDYFIQYFKENPQANSEIKRVIADGDLVWLHVHSKANPQDLGTAVVDIFRVEKGKIVEHWDVIQDVPKESANQNGMF